MARNAARKRLGAFGAVAHSWTCLALGAALLSFALLPSTVASAGQSASALRLSNSSGQTALAPRINAHVARPNCHSVVSPTAIQVASEYPMVYLGQGQNPVRGGVHNGQIGFFSVGGLVGFVPGSVCEYNDLDPNAPFHQFYTQGVVAVGYGVTERNWLKFRSLSKLNEPNSEDIPDSLVAENAPESPLNLGGGTQAFVNTLNLVAGDDADPTTYPTLPTSMYMITVFTKRHNILQVCIYGATLASTKTLVESSLVRDAAYL
jgi:hypothetical protein